MTTPTTQTRASLRRLTLAVLVALTTISLITIWLSPAKPPPAPASPPSTEAVTSPELLPDTAVVYHVDEHGTAALLGTYGSRPGHDTLSGSSDLVYATSRPAWGDQLERISVQKSMPSQDHFTADLCSDEGPCRPVKGQTIVCSEDDESYTCTEFPVARRSMLIVRFQDTGPGNPNIRFDPTTLRQEAGTRLAQATPLNVDES